MSHCPFQCPSFRKRAPWFQPRWLLGCLLGLLTPLGSRNMTGELEQTKAAFSSLASYPYCLLCWVLVVIDLEGLLYQVDNGVSSPASSLCSFLWMSGVAWVIKSMASAVLPSMDSRSILVSSLNAAITWPRKTAEISSFSLCKCLRLYHNLQASPYTFSFLWQTSSKMSHPSLAYTIFIVQVWVMFWDCTSSTW